MMERVVRILKHGVVGLMPGLRNGLVKIVVRIRWEPIGYIRGIRVRWHLGHLSVGIQVQTVGIERNVVVGWHIVILLPDRTWK